MCFRGRANTIFFTQIQSLRPLLALNFIDFLRISLSHPQTPLPKCGAERHHATFKNISKFPQESYFLTGIRSQHGSCESHSTVKVPRMMFTQSYSIPKSKYSMKEKPFFLSVRVTAKPKGHHRDNGEIGCVNTRRSE